jgi:tRNA threonylcarbamoyladenosine biosynthesis protein TsaB
VGVTTAKTLAYAVDAEVVGINTLEVIATQTPENVARLWAVMDAQRRQVFAARFERDANGCWQTAEPTKIIDEEKWLNLLEEDEWISGPVLHRLADEIPSNVSIVDRAIWAPKATTVGSIAQRRYLAGDRDDVWQLVPHYFRKSAAAEKWEKRK